MSRRAEEAPAGEWLTIDALDDMERRLDKDSTDELGILIGARVQRALIRMARAAAMARVAVKATGSAS